jgi:type IV secretion system protein VirB8
MTPDKPDLKADYYAQAETWANDRNAALRSSRTIAWIIASLALIVVVLEAIALMVLMPLKTVVPYTLMVDRQTGYVQALDPLAPNRIAPDAALTQSFLVQYVIAREGFDFATVQADYRKVALWSADSASNDYIAAMQVANPDSPLARLPRGAVVETRVRSVSALGNRTALVRFETVRRDRGGSLQPAQGWVTIIDYRFSDKPMSTEDRFLNPLGFQVVRYRRNAETPPVPIIETVPPMPVSPPVANGAPIVTPQNSGRSLVTPQAPRSPQP